MTDIMKLADDYAQHKYVNGAEGRGPDAPEARTGYARAALQSAIEALQADRDQLQRDFTYMKQQRDALQSKLDAMGKGEPVQYQYRDARDDGTWSAWVGCDKPLQPNTWRQVRELYASSNALAPEPLTDEQIYNVFAATVEDAEPFAELVGDPIWAEVVEITRAIEAAHGIHAKGGQQ